MTPDSGPRSWPDRSRDYENHIGTKRSVNRETSTIIVGIGSCEWEGICLFTESQFGRQEVIVRDISRMSGSAVGFEMTRAQRIAAGRRVIVQRATNDPVFGLGFCAGGTKLGLD